MRSRKKLEEAEIILANERLRKAEEARESETPAADPQTKNVLTTTQWLSVIFIIILVVGIYYKREEI